MATPTPTIVTAKIGQREEIATAAIILSLSFDKPFAFIPGQYIWVELPAEICHDPTDTRRAFSIAGSSEDKRTLQILFRPSSSGYKKSLLELPIGSLMRVHGPFGSVFTPEKLTAQEVVMIAGGVGVAPFHSLLQSPQVDATHPACTLLHCNHQDASAPFAEFFGHKMELEPWFEYHDLHRRFCWEDVPGSIRENEARARAISWWIVGSQPMVTAVHSVLLAHGVSEEQMRFEQFYPAKAGNLTLEQVATSIGSEGILTQTIQNSTNHTVITDANGYVLFANQAAEKTTGYSFAEMKGNTPRLWGGLMSPEFYSNFWRLKKSGENFSGELQNRRKNGDRYYVIGHISPIKNPEGTVIGYIGTEEDITPIREQEQRLEQLTVRFQLATKSAQIGVWDWDVVNNNLSWDDQMYILFGIKRDQFSGAYEAWQNTLHPDDKDSANEAVQQALRGESDLNTTFRINWSTGETHFIRAFAIVERDDAGAAIKMVGVNWDVTSEKLIDQAKTEFVSLASHQLRTPLTSINWYTEMLLNGDAGPINDEQKKYLEEVYTGSKRMVELVSSLLNVSRIELGTFAVNPEPTDLIALLRSVTDELKPQIDDQLLHLSESHDEGLPIIAADPKLIRMVYQNLLTNAVKYTPKEGTITVTHRKLHVPTLGDCIHIAIQDSGVGIPAEEQDKIFSKLYRASNVQEIDTQGTGLGLYIVKAIVDQAGGQISFESQLNQGTTFHINLPLKGMEQKTGSKPLE